MIEETDFETYLSVTNNNFQIFLFDKKKFKNLAHNSPTARRRGCLCKDNTYSVDCCDGSLHAQGIGKTQAT